MENREIKFRGNRTDGKGWVYGYLVRMKGTSKMLIDRTPSDPKDWVYKDMVFDNCLIATMQIPNYQGWDYDDCVIFNKVHPESVGQFTGLKDKNGVDIYERDILKCHDGFIYRVWFVKGGFATNVHVDMFKKDIAMKYPFPLQPLADEQTVSYIESQCEIIGNTFDNPELIKQP